MQEIKLTEDEKVILRNLPERFKWIARDFSGYLFIYSDKPLKGKNMWHGEEILYWADISCFEHLFQFIKWKDEEPYLIEDLLKM